tara:strand:+ start:256 stop:498 length:243 start_codon:yes stop_codon:yes gene_type:complete
MENATRPWRPGFSVFHARRVFRTRLRFLFKELFLFRKYSAMPPAPFAGPSSAAIFQGCQRQHLSNAAVRIRRLVDRLIKP